MGLGLREVPKSALGVQLIVLDVFAVSRPSQTAHSVKESETIFIPFTARKLSFQLYSQGYHIERLHSDVEGMHEAHRLRPRALAAEHDPHRRPPDGHRCYSASATVKASIHIKSEVEAVDFAVLPSRNYFL